MESQAAHHIFAQYCVGSLAHSVNIIQIKWDFQVVDLRVFTEAVHFNICDGKRNADSNSEFIEPELGFKMHLKVRCLKIRDDDGNVLYSYLFD